MYLAGNKVTAPSAWLATVSLALTPELPFSLRVLAGPSYHTFLTPTTVFSQRLGRIFIRITGSY